MQTDIKTEYPFLRQALSATLDAATPGEREELLLLYRHLDCRDILGAAPETMLGYVRASRKARQLLSYTSRVPEELYAPYVLNPRVNNEWPDGSREWLLECLYPRVKDLDMMAAALEVNYWCCEQATYRSTDERTIGPLGICRRGFGRCGEESTLLVCALRAVGIPARQVYAPYWAHCDDNHAWVEFWADGDWHYMGACEPEYTADQGWFQSAASRAMLIRSRVPDPEQAEGWKIVNSTCRYAKTAWLRVQVTHHGIPVSGAEVRFQLVNYSRIQTLHRERTDEYGFAAMETGLGSLLVSTCADGLYTEKLVTLPGETAVALRLEDGFDPKWAATETRFTFHVPREIIPRPLPKNQAHQQRLLRCDEMRQKKLSHFDDKTSPWLAKARGNQAEIAAFLALEEFSAADKALLLETLTDKDFCDCTCAVLESFLRCALPWKSRYPLSVWQWELLAPRVENEPLLNIRPALHKLLAEYRLSTPQQVLDWMAQYLRCIPEYGLTDRRGNAAGYVANGCCPESEWDILAVQICRALGIPAALDAQTGKLLPDRNGPQVVLSLNASDQPLTEEEHFSLSRWEGDCYVPIHLGGCTITGETSFSLEPGSYCLTVVRRQIDGDLDAVIHRFPLCESQTLALTSPPDHTAHKLRTAPLPQITLTPLTDNAAAVSLHCQKQPSLLVFLDPGKEPTEHLLQEFLALAEEFAPVPIQFLLEFADGLCDSTLKALLGLLPRSAAYLFREADRFALQRAAEIGDFRLPLVLALDGQRQIRYGCANYNIRTAARLLHILSLIR